MSKTKYPKENSQVHLIMECQEDKLSLAQISAYTKREDDFTTAYCTQQVFMNNGDIFYENDSIMLVYLKTSIGSSQNLEVTPDKDIFLTRVDMASYTDRHLIKPPSLLRTALIHNKVLNSTKTSFTECNEHDSSLCTESLMRSLPFKDGYYQLIMDTKLGLIINGRLENNYLSDTNSSIINPILSLGIRPNPPIKPITASFPSTSTTSMPCYSTSAIPKNHVVVQNNATVIPSFEFKDDGMKTTFKKRVFACLLVIARPCLLMRSISRKMINEEQLRLDEKVKVVLTLSAAMFTEWLLKQGLIQSEQYCTTHDTVKNSQVKLKLGMYSDETKFINSGGYVWVSDCCPMNFTSIFKSSIFEGAPYEPAVLLKLLYHWSCQTNSEYVVQWVKISSFFLKRFYSALRAVCIAAVHEEYKELLGGENIMVEVGIISLGTLSEGNIKRTKAWILGAMESQTKRLRLHVTDPINSSELNSTKKKMLEPLLQSVHKDSVILTDLSLDRNMFIRMGYSNIFQMPIIQFKNNKHIYSNDNIMKYLKNSIPRMFQSTLSLLSKQVIQQFLDELTWREKWGPTSSRAFDFIINCIEKQTKIDTGASLYSSLSKIALYPFMNWQYLNWKSNFNILNKNLHDQTDPVNKMATSVSNSEIYKQNLPETTLLCSTDTSTPLKPIASSNGKLVPPDLKNLENYYYGQLDGNKHLLELEKKCDLQMKCILCSNTINTNINMMKHIITHALCTYENNVNDKKWCKYCLKEFGNDENLETHIDITHLHLQVLRTNLKCLICETSFKYRTKLILHMHCLHNEVEMPYECSICKFRSSEHRCVIDHFYEKHNNGEKAQCPICLKVVAFKHNGRKITQNIYFFLNHIKKHTCKKLIKKCNRCVLSFINKGVLEYHQRTYHKSCKDVQNVRRYDGVVTVWMPVPFSSPVNEEYQAQKVSERLINYFERDEFILKINVNESAEYMCCECEGYILEEGHFPGNLSCLRCSFKTCCEKSIIEHVIKFHDNAPRKSVNVGRQIILNRPMRCICGFKSISGNKLANHAVQCNKKSIYPVTRTVYKNKFNTESVSSKVIDSTNQVNTIDKLLKNETEQQKGNITLSELINYKQITDSSENSNGLTTLITNANSSDTDKKPEFTKDLKTDLKIPDISEENMSANEKQKNDTDEPPNKKPKLMENN